MQEHQSIARLKQGDIGGLEELVRKYYLQAVRAAHLVVQDHDLAEDIAQASFIDLRTKIRHFDESKDFHPWFFRSVVNNAISVCRRQKREITLVVEDESGNELATLERLSEAGSGLEETYITEETRQAIWQTLKQLTVSQRAAIVLRYYLELSENEITKELDRPKSTIKWTLFAARGKLRQLLGSIQAEETQPISTEQKEEK